MYTIVQTTRVGCYELIAFMQYSSTFIA